MPLNDKRISSTGREHLNHDTEHNEEQSGQRGPADWFMEQKENVDEGNKWGQIRQIGQLCWIAPIHRHSPGGVGQAIGQCAHPKRPAPLGDRQRREPFPTQKDGQDYKRRRGVINHSGNKLITGDLHVQNRKKGVTGGRQYTGQHSADV